MAEPFAPDPVEYGRLLSSVEQLTRTIEAERADRTEAFGLASEERARMIAAMTTLEGRIAELENKLRLGKFGAFMLFLGIGVSLFGLKKFIENLWSGLT